VLEPGLVPEMEWVSALEPELARALEPEPALVPEQVQELVLVRVPVRHSWRQSNRQAR
jgi:hypothetical protein